MRVEWHAGELYPRVGFVVANSSKPAERGLAFYNQRGRAEQWIKDGKIAVRSTRLSCRTVKVNAVRLQLHALAYNTASFLRTSAPPDEMECWSLTTFSGNGSRSARKLSATPRYAIFQMAEVAVPRRLFRRIIEMIDDLPSRHVAQC